jgi:hypothetical protein
MHDGLDQTISHLGDVEHSIFISTWTRRGVKTGSWIANVQIGTLMDWEIAAAYPEELYGGGVIFDRLPGFEQSLEDHMANMAPLTPEYLKRYTSHVDIEDDDLWIPTETTRLKISNAERLLYKTLRAIKLMERAERQSGTKFTHILRLRPDRFIEHSISNNLDHRSYFDYAGWSDDQPPERRLGDNLILAPRDLFIPMLINALQRCRNYLLNDPLRDDIHNILGQAADFVGADVGTIGMQTTNGGWPIDVFEKSLKKAVEKRPEDNVLSGLYHHINANRLLANHAPEAALKQLDFVTPDRHGTVPHLRILALAYHALGNIEISKNYAKLAEQNYARSDHATIINMADIMTEIRRVIP